MCVGVTVDYVTVVVVVAADDDDDDDDHGIVFIGGRPVRHRIR